MDSDFTTALTLLEATAIKPPLSTGYPELDHLIGRGIAPGIFYLFYGDPASGLDRVLHYLMARALGTGDGSGRVVYLNCGNYREDKTILDIPYLVRGLKAQRVDPREALERVLVYCAFSEEQQEQVVEEVRQTIEATAAVRLLVVHNVAKLFTAPGRRDRGWYQRIPRLQRAVVRLWQACAVRDVALVASCRPAPTRRGRRPRPEGGRYLAHEANVIVYLEQTKGLVIVPQAYLVKHPARPPGRVVLTQGGENAMGRITVPFKQRLDAELDALHGFRDALKDLERQAAYDRIIRACTSEQGALANTTIPAVLDALLLMAAVDNRRRIDQLSRRLDALEAAIHQRTPGNHP